MVVLHRSSFTLSLCWPNSRHGNHRLTSRRRLVTGGGRHNEANAADWQVRDGKIVLPRLKISGSACWWFPAWFLFRENFGELRQTVLFSSVPFRFCIHQLIVSSRDQSKSRFNAPKFGLRRSLCGHTRRPRPAPTMRRTPTDEVDHADRSDTCPPPRVPSMHHWLRLPLALSALTHLSRNSFGNLTPRKKPRFRKFPGKSDLRRR